MAIRILGAMTGTSCDGLDAVCVEFTDASRWKTLWSKSRPYPARLRESVLRLQRPGERARLQDLLALDAQLGEWYARELGAMTREAPIELRPHAIANHGQTVAHFPGRSGGGSTLQLGDPARIAARTGLSVISRFRDGDLAAGGQGAPLLPLFHQGIARSLGNAGIAIHNLGGISNFTYARPDGSVLAFDTGPANCWIDEAVVAVTRGKRAFDRDGKMGARGAVDAKAVLRVLKDHPYFRRRAPKSTGRDDFPFRFFKSRTRTRGDDLVATATLVTVESVAQAYEREVLKNGWPLSAIYVCGGGAKNAFLLECLRARMSPVNVLTTAEIGIPPETMEAQAFAWFGYLSLLGRPLGGEWTGVRAFGPPGAIVPGENWREVLASLK